MTKIIEFISAESNLGHKYHLRAGDDFVVESDYEYYLRLGFSLDANSKIAFNQDSRLYIEQGNIINNGQLINYGQIFNSI